MSAETPQITVIGKPPNQRWLFNGKTYNTRKDAEAAQSAYEQAQKDEEDERERRDSPGQGS